MAATTEGNDGSLSVQNMSSANKNIECWGFRNCRFEICWSEFNQVLIFLFIMCYCKYILIHMLNDALYMSWILYHSSRTCLIVSWITRVKKHCFILSVRQHSAYQIFLVVRHCAYQCSCRCKITPIYLYLLYKTYSVLVVVFYNIWGFTNFPKNNSGVTCEPHCLVPVNTFLYIQK
jgi:hypothetical protein